MPIFKINKEKLESIKEAPIKLERDLQKLTEDNLREVFGLKFVATEFALGGFRIDTLAYDEENKSFVIIEYKRDKSFSVVDQGFSYLSLMLNNKADFILEYNEENKDSLRKGDVDWSQSRVLFLANSFTSHQLNSINFKDLPIELWKVRKYNNNTILYNEIESMNKSESIKTISKDEKIKNVSREIKTYSVDDHISKSSEKTVEIYEKLRDGILNLDDRIKENPKKLFIGYMAVGCNVVCLWIRKDFVSIELLRTDPKTIKDPEKKAKYYEKSLKHYGQHIHILKVDKIEDVDYAMYLIKQSYKAFSEKYL